MLAKEDTDTGRKGEITPSMERGHIAVSSPSPKCQDLGHAHVCIGCAFRAAGLGFEPVSQGRSGFFNH